MKTYGIEKLGIVNPKAVYRNLTPDTVNRGSFKKRRGQTL